MSALRITGMIMAALGSLMAIFPGWFEPLTGGPEAPANLFETIERRIRGGMLAGFGLVLIARTELRPWSVTIASVVFYFVIGALAARILGLMVDGSDSKQWMYVAIEGVIITLAAVWLWRAGASG